MTTNPKLIKLSESEKQLNLELILLTSGGLEPKRSSNCLLLSTAPKKQLNLQLIPF